MDKIFRNRIRSGMFAAFFLLPLAAHAEDIDIFAGPTSPTELPNVLIIWDSSANWSTAFNVPVPDCSFSDGTGGPKATEPNKEQGKKFAIEKCAVYNVIDALGTGPGGAALYNVGLMLFNESTAPKGGYPRVQLLPMTSANKATMKNVIRNITIGGDKGNNAAFSKALYEAYLMFSKAVPYQGTAGTKWDPTAVSGGNYVGPPGSGCADHIIFLANGGPGDNNGEAQALLQNAGGNATQILYPSSYITNSDQANWADEYARFLRGVDVSSQAGVQSIITHGVAVVGASGDGLYPNFIHAMANQGGGQYYAASDVAMLVKALTDIFNSIQSVNSVFASASLPIAVNAQGSYKNQLFVGVFRPDVSAAPRWVGNLKQYKMHYNAATDSLELVDSQDNPALNAATGFFLPTAVSYWSKASAFWVNSPSGTPPSPSDLPDGDVVEKGANAELLRTAYAVDQSGRKIYTCIDCGGTTLLTAANQRFTSANALITTTMLGLAATDSTQRAALINWILGADNNGDELGPGGTTTVRPSIHGDVLHSRPAVVNYGGTTGTIVYYGGNDGMLHVVDGNQTGATAGNELWTFIPQELFGRFKRLRADTPEIRFPATPTSSSATPRDYFVDGPLTVYQKLDNAGAVAQVLLFVPMRRGGRFLYALDVTNPSAPKYLWRKTSGEISVLGQTWSEARVGTLQGYSVCPARTRAATLHLADPGCPILIMGAGYDNVAEDASPAGATTMGAAVLIFDALDGTLLKTLPTLKSVAAPVAVIDTDYDGYADRAYVVDMGANVYRIDFETAAGDGALSNWTITKIAALADGSNTRKFFYEPDVVLTRRFAALMIGSGNRERPLLASTNDRFYTLFDYRAAKGAPTAAVVMDATLKSAPLDLNSSVPGCYYAMATSGEKVLTSSVSTGGYSYFSTNQPSPPAPGSCVSNLGIAKTYRMPLFCGTPDSVELAGGGLPPSPVIGNVEIDIPASGTQPASTRMVPFIIGGSSISNSVRSGIGVSRVPVEVDPTRRRVYWFTSSGP